MMKLILFFPTLLFGVFAEEQPVTYGVDISFPQHYYNASSNFAWLPHK